MDRCRCNNLKDIGHFGSLLGFLGYFFGEAAAAADVFLDMWKTRGGLETLKFHLTGTKAPVFVRLSILSESNRNQNDVWMKWMKNE